MGKLFNKEYEIHFYELDHRLKCTISTILNFIEDVGTEQSERLGAGMEYLLERNMAWVFYQYDVLVNRYPSYGEKIKVVTEPMGFNKFYAIRSYKMYDENGEKIVEATAIFFLINFEKRKIMRVPLEQYDIYDVDVNAKLNHKIEKIEKLEEVMYTRDFKVRFGDIDANRHVNNITYVQWSIESVPLEILNNYEIERIKVNFEKECTYGDEVRVSIEIREDCDNKVKILHKIENKEGKILTNIVGMWRKIN